MEDDEKTEVVEQAVVKVLDSRPVRQRLKDVAKIEAMIDTYAKVYKNYEDFIVTESFSLVENKHPNAFIRATMARLVSQWLLDTRIFIEQNEEVLDKAGEEVRKHFIEESLSDFPVDIRERLLKQLREKKEELLIWFGNLIFQAKAEAKNRIIADAKVVDGEETEIP